MKIRDCDNQKEMDFLIDRNGKFYPFEIKLNYNSSHAFKNFDVLDSIEMPIGYGGLIHAGDEIIPAKTNYWLIPSRLV